MATDLDTYLPRIRKAISDKGKLEHEEFIGDGSSLYFYLSATPIGADSIEVYLDGVATEDFTLDYESGILVFDTAPAENTVIIVLYTSYLFSDTELIEYLEVAIVDSKQYLDYTWTISGVAPDSSISETPTDEVVRVWLILLQINIKEDSMFAAAEKSISWSTEGMSVNRSNIVSASIASVKQLNHRLNILSYYINSTATFSEQVLAGGYVPDSWPIEVGDFYIPEDKYQR